MKWLILKIISLRSKWKFGAMVGYTVVETACISIKKALPVAISITCFSKSGILADKEDLAGDFLAGVSRQRAACFLARGG